MTKAMSLRSIYGPAHFGNCYEVMAPREFQELCREWQRNGINGYASWFNTYDVPNPFSDDPLYRWPRERALRLWWRKRDCLKAAQDLGLTVGMALTTNSVYIDQLKREWAAESNDKGYIGPDLCPAHPEVRAMLRKNNDDLLKFLREGGVRVKNIMAFFYDWGGCDCAQCRPWIKNALRLWEEELAPAARAIEPEVKIQFCTWCLNDEEHGLFQDLMARQPDWLDGLLISPGYETEWPAVEVPKPYQKMLFLHNSYSSQKADRYGRTGMVAAPARLEAIFRKCARDGDIDGFQAYSEGIYDDLNKFLIGHLGQDPLLDVRALAAEYCRQYFKTNPADTAALVDAIYRIELLTQNPADAAALAEILDALGRKNNLAGNWRFEIMLIRAKVSDLNHRIGNKARWEEAVKGLDAAGKRRFIAQMDTLVVERQGLLEHLERDVYRTGTHTVPVMYIDLKWQPWQEYKHGIKAIEDRKDVGRFMA